MKHIINLSDSDTRQKLGEVVRFGIVGTVATAVQYGVYLLMLPLMKATLANTVAYIVSMTFNFFASTYFTFRTSPNAKKAGGFAFSHLVNYLLQTLLLALFIGLGVSRRLALLPVLAVCVPVNFLLVRHFLRRKPETADTDTAQRNDSGRSS